MREIIATGINLANFIRGVNESVFVKFCKGDGLFFDMDEDYIIDVTEFVSEFVLSVDNARLKIHFDKIRFTMISRGIVNSQLCLHGRINHVNADNVKIERLILCADSSGQIPEYPVDIYAATLLPIRLTTSGDQSIRLFSANIGIYNESKWVTGDYIVAGNNGEFTASDRAKITPSKTSVMIDAKLGWIVTGKESYKLNFSPSDVGEIIRLLTASKIYILHGISCDYIDLTVPVYLMGCKIKEVNSNFICSEFKSNWSQHATLTDDILFIHIVPGTTHISATRCHLYDKREQKNPVIITTSWLKLHCRKGIHVILVGDNYPNAIIKNGFVQNLDIFM